MTGGRSPKRKGTRVEQELARLLVELGLPCSRVPLSGAIGGAWSNDIELELLDRVLRAEVKARRQLQVYGWLGKADLLILKGDRQPPLIVMPVKLFAELAAAIMHSPASDPPQEFRAHVHFDPALGTLFCGCGAELNAFCTQRRPDGSAFVRCDRCKAELGLITADVEVYA